MPFQDSSTKRLHLVFPEHLLLQSVRFSVPRSLSCLMWRLLHMKLTRVHLHVLRTHLQRCRHLLRSVLNHFRQPVVTSPSSEGKTRKCSCEENIAPRRVVDAWGSNRHSLRPRRKHESGTRGATKLHRARFIFQSWQKSVLTALPASFAVASRNQQTKHQGHQSPLPRHGLSGTRVVTAMEGVIHRPARARLPDAEQTRAKSIKSDTHI